jgi:hypothetical protein
MESTKLCATEQNEIAEEAGAFAFGECSTLEQAIAEFKWAYAPEVVTQAQLKAFTRGWNRAETRN